MTDMVSHKMVAYGDRVREVEPTIRKEAIAIYRKNLGRAVVIAKQLVLKDTERLEETIREEEINPFQFALVAGGIMATGHESESKYVDYAPYVEEEAPFIAPAAESVRNDILEELKSIGANIR